jgi:hypothetical protein
MRSLLLLVFCAAFSSLAVGQQTILNIPSADVLDKGQIDSRVDAAFFPSSQRASLAPNFIFGQGHGVEAGVNINAFAVPADSANRSIVPNFKWKFLSNKPDAPTHFDMYLGDQVFLPTFHRAFDAGTYAYAAGALTIHKDTRLTFGGWDSANVVVNGNRGGGLLGMEWTVAHQKDRNLVTLAADWQSGRATNGALAMGAMFFPTDRLMVIPAFQLANSGDHNANGIEMFIGYLLKAGTPK